MNEIKENYWACDNCMKKAGGIDLPNHICTMRMGTCKICNVKGVVLIPWVDYQWPNKSDNLRAIMSRD